MWLVVLLAQVLPRPQPIFSFQKTWFFGNLFEYSAAENYFKINISHILYPNLYQINSIKSCSSRSFQQHGKGTFQFLQNFQLRFKFIFSEEIIHCSRTFAPQVQTSWNFQADAPFLLESFPKETKNVI